LYRNTFFGCISYYFCLKILDTGYKWCSQNNMFYIIFWFFRISYWYLIIVICHLSFLILLIDTSYSCRYSVYVFNINKEVFDILYNTNSVFFHKCVYYVHVFIFNFIKNIAKTWNRSPEMENRICSACQFMTQFKKVSAVPLIFTNA